MSWGLRHMCELCTLQVEWSTTAPRFALLAVHWNMSTVFLVWGRLIAVQLGCYLHRRQNRSDNIPKFCAECRLSPVLVPKNLVFMQICEFIYAVLHKVQWFLLVLLDNICTVWILSAKVLDNCTRVSWFQKPFPSVMLYIGASRIQNYQILAFLTNEAPVHMR